MKKFSLLFFLISFLCFGCVSSNRNVEVVSDEVTKLPKWISDQGRLELFPDSNFISQLAYGNSAEQAKSKAASNISEYIKSSHLFLYIFILWIY